ncbi:hypothetical protein [Kutzneria sp. CA-103260]|uniref:hypothetical protein n=1 Tax=Kutzneria sp. CA-103260 TaxID=2802641 RepID=UPI001BA6D686|nr:hypothetical protein [Kutzneria sp. CA-103260]QUQ65231.1 hypothetical protein JJ691_29530 [Kutzneria sp. CA-103260]
MTMTNVAPRGDTVLRSVLHLADLAPHAGGYQWRLTDGAAHLHLDTPDSSSNVLLGVGAVLHHLRVALAAAGWGALIARGTTPSDPTHVASIRAIRQQPTPEQVAMAAAISIRSGDDADYSEAAVPWTVLHRLALQARAEGAELHLVLDHETRLKMLRRTRSLRNAGVLAVIGANDVMAAGAALSAVLLMGTVWGLLGYQLPVRPPLAQAVVGPDLTPHVVLRLGYPRT